MRRKAIPSQRHEAKLVLPRTLLYRLDMWLRVHEAEFDPVYQPRWVNNLYFDTENFATLAEAIEGTGRRVKVRLRWYGQQQPITDGGLEFKCKAGNLGWKHRFPIATSLDLTRPWREILASLHAALPPEQRIIFRHADRPALINRYHRTYHISFDRAVRITIDQHLRAWSQVTGLRPNLTRCQPHDDLIVIEFKAEHKATALLRDAIHALGCRIDKHSKYATGMTGTLL